MQPATKEKIGDVFPLAAALSSHTIGFVSSHLAANSRQAINPADAFGIGPSPSVSPTSHWPCTLCSYEIASDSLVQRYYSPTFGRFDSPDPSGAADPHSPQSWNRYMYVEGDPVNYTDSTGLIKHCPPGTRSAGSGFNMYCVANPSFETVQTGNGLDWARTQGDDWAADQARDRRQLLEQEIASRVVAAGQTALDALRNRSDCAGLFNLAPGAPAASDVLNSLLSADPAVGSILVTEIFDRPGEETSAVAVAVNPVLSSIGGGSTAFHYTYVQVQINELAGLFLGNNVVDQAATLLHELGHVFSAMYGPGSTSIADDDQDIDTSEGNSGDVKKHCF